MGETGGKLQTYCGLTLNFNMIIYTNVKLIFVCFEVASGTVMSTLRAALEAEITTLAEFKLD